ncbi:MAG TPA: SpoIIE family protein phosphatase [Solirubrobacteraceae bacterium]|nr:SpoIIE family protein phosphatase [Solirubrobacteraceae bacterium]
MTLRARTGLLLAAFAAVLVVCGLLISSTLAAAEERERALSERLDPAAQLARKLLVARVEQGTRIRSYVFTGDEEFLDSLRGSRQRAREAAARLRSIMDDEPRILQALARAERAAAGWATFARREARATREGDMRRARQLEVTREGQERFDVLREGISELQEEIEDERLDAAEMDAVADRRLVTAVAGSGIALVILVALGAVVVVRSVLRPVGSLRASLRRVAGGELTSAVEVAGPPEVRAIGRDAEAMRRRILEELDTARAAHEGLTQREPVVAALRDQLRPSAVDPPPGVRVVGTVHSAEGVLAGDWYDVVRLPGGRVAVVVADVSGHGARAGSLAAQFKQALVTALSLGRLGPAALVAARTVLDDPEQFVTCVIAELDPPTGRLRITNAGHPPPVVLAARPEGSMIPLRTLSSPGSVVSRMVEPDYASHEATLAEGELLLLYTDGLVEARDDDGHLLGLEGVARALARTDDPHPQAVIDACLDAARSFRSPSRRDDITLVALGREPVRAALMPAAPAPGARP